MKFTRETRALYAQKLSDEIDAELRDPKNFTKNKVAEEAASHITIIGGDDNVSTEST